MISDEARRADNLVVLDRVAHARFGTQLTAQDVLGPLMAARAGRAAELGVPGEDR